MRELFICFKEILNSSYASSQEQVLSISDKMTNECVHICSILQNMLCSCNCLQWRSELIAAQKATMFSFIRCCYSKYSCEKKKCFIWYHNDGIFYSTWSIMDPFYCEIKYFTYNEYADIYHECNLSSSINKWQMKINHVWSKYPLIYIQFILCL